MTNSTERYMAAAHAMQSGVATEIGLDGLETGAASPKHLRVGVNSAQVANAALAGLLIAKGIITQEDYAEALAAGMEAEQERYEQHLSARLGKTVKLA